MTYTVLLICMIAIGTNGCKEDSILNGVSGDQMSAIVNGSPFETTDVSGSRTPASTGIGEGFSVIGYTSTGSPLITLTLYSTSQGNYNLGIAGQTSTSASIGISPSSILVSTSGSISIETINYSEGGLVKGTFQFETSADTIENGSFAARFSN